MAWKKRGEMENGNGRKKGVKHNTSRKNGGWSGLRIWQIKQRNLRDPLLRNEAENSSKKSPEIRVALGKSRGKRQENSHEKARNKLAHWQVSRSSGVLADHSNNSTQAPERNQWIWLMSYVISPHITQPSSTPFFFFSLFFFCFLFPAPLFSRNLLGKEKGFNREIKKTGR